MDQTAIFFLLQVFWSCVNVNHYDLGIGFSIFLITPPQDVFVCACASACFYVQNYVCSDSKAEIHDTFKPFEFSLK